MSGKIIVKIKSGEFHLSDIWADKEAFEELGQKGLKELVNEDLSSFLEEVSIFDLISFEWREDPKPTNPYPYEERLPIYLKGQIIVCPSCSSEQHKFTRDVYQYDRVEETLLEPMDGVRKLLNGYAANCQACGSNLFFPMWNLFKIKK